ncbi:MAG: MaoC family dehydratase [Acidimicrobiales bacterium]
MTEGGGDHAGRPGPEVDDGRGWYRSLVVGHQERTPARVVTAAELRQLLASTGYRHPLFAEAVRSSVPGGDVPVPGGDVPVPGGLLLGMLGGLAEQCQLLEVAPVVLAGFNNVRFRRPVVAGDSVWAELRVEGKRTTAGGTGLVDVSWVARNQRDDVVVSLVATFAVRGSVRDRPAPA